MRFAPPVAENRCTFQVVSSASYRYERPAHRVSTVLRLVPPDLRGNQSLRSHEVQVAPLPFDVTETTEQGGNRVVEVRNEQVKENLTIVARLTVDTSCRFDREGRPLPAPIPLVGSLEEEAAWYCEPTRRTEPNGDMDRTVRDVCRWHDPQTDPFGFAAGLRSRIRTEMTFAAGVTHVGTTAAEAWAGRRGVCQDYAHVMVTMLRLANIPARYVSGFVPGEGVMHAWAEALLPVAHSPEGTRSGAGEQSHAWYAIDPTYDKWVDEKYVGAAVGRDYADATPTSGSYYGGASTLRYGARMRLLHKEMVLL